MGTYLRAKIDPSSYFSFSYPGILGNITRNFRLAMSWKLMPRSGRRPAPILNLELKMGLQYVTAFTA